MYSPVAVFLGFAHLAVISSCKSLGRWGDLVVKHSWDEIPRGWEYKAPAPADYAFELKFAMKQPRIDELIANLMEVSDPNHSRYAKYLNREQVAQFTAPHPDSVQVVDEWLAFHNITSYDSVRRSKAGDWVTVRVTVEQAERLLGTKYHIYKHGESSVQVVRTLSYSLPEELISHIDVVVPTTYFGTLRTMKTTSSLVSGTSLNSAIDLTSVEDCTKVVIPDCIRSLYNFSDFAPNKSTNKIGVTGFLNQSASYSDLQVFLNKYCPDLNATGSNSSNFTTILINDGQNNQTNPGIEANLDIQFTTGLAFPTPITYYSTGGSPPFNSDSVNIINTNEPYMEFLDHLLQSEDIPHVLTTSYGDYEQTVPQDYAENVCKKFAVLGTRGTTVFFASGDDGVGRGDCQTNNQTLFQPVFPASCPYVTAVGGTEGNPEVAANFSGGGFSRYFLRPSYQSKDVEDFLTNLTTYQGMFRRDGRAYPDISAQSVNFRVVMNQADWLVSGTSASSPTVAAIFSLLNDLRLAANQTTLGFINTFIYSKGKSGFNDITSGNNPGCKTMGFTAGSGWDPVTGLGTPNFPKLKEILNANDLI